MNLYNGLNKEDMTLLQEAGVEIKNREYDQEELKKCENQVVEYIMSHSMNEISIVERRYRNLLQKITF